MEFSFTRAGRVFAIRVRGENENIHHPGSIERLGILFW